MSRARDHDVVVVTHVSPIKATLAWALGTDGSLSWRVFVELASIGASRWASTARSSGHSTSGPTSTDVARNAATPRRRAAAPARGRGDRAAGSTRCRRRHPCRRRPARRPAWAFRRSRPRADLGSDRSPLPAVRPPRRQHRRQWCRAMLTRSVVGSRLITSHTSRSTRARSASTSGGANATLNSLAKHAARRGVRFGPPPPITIGGWGRWAGFGDAGELVSV